jgi:uroporphyrinogen-III synthase
MRNRRVLVACSAGKMLELAGELETMGASVLSFPVIKAKPVEDRRALDQAITSLRKYDWIIFTSVHGVEFFMQRLNELGFGNQGMPKICAVGPATAAGLRKFGREAALLPKEYVGEGILKALIDYYGGINQLAGLDFLLPRAKAAREFLPEALSEAGAKVDVVPCYQTVRSKIDPGTMKKFEEKKPDLLVFTSSSTINNLMDILGADIGRRTLMESTVAVIGPITASTAAAYGKRADIIPRENTIASLLEAIREYYSNQ